VVDGYADMDVQYTWTYGSKDSIAMASDMALSQFDLVGIPHSNTTLTQASRGHYLLYIKYRASLLLVDNVFNYMYTYIADTLTQCFSKCLSMDLCRSASQWLPVHKPVITGLRISGCWPAESWLEIKIKSNAGLKSLGIAGRIMNCVLMSDNLLSTSMYTQQRHISIREPGEFAYRPKPIAVSVLKNVKHFTHTTVDRPI